MKLHELQALCRLTPAAKLSTVLAMLDPAVHGYPDVGPLISREEALAILETPKDNPDGAKKP